MIDFAAIDFETANSNPSSVCSVGVVIVHNQQIVERIYRLIRPVPEWYSAENTRIHSLTVADTANEPFFPCVWKEIAPKITNLQLVAHNSSFDETCLKDVHLAYQMHYPNYTFFCTCRISRHIFGKILPNHRLHTVARHCGYDLTNHHHALADAEACAIVAMKIL